VLRDTLSALGAGRAPGENARNGATHV